MTGTRGRVGRVGKQGWATMRDDRARPPVEARVIPLIATSWAGTLR
jgi:hypothetical protein